MLSSACQEKELPEMGLVLLTLVPRAINVSVPWAGGGDGVQRAHLFQSPWSLVLWGACGNALAGKHVCVAATCSWNKTPLHVSQERESGHCSYVQSREGFVLCCLCKVAVSAPDTHRLLLLPGSSLALTLLAWDWFSFWGCCRCLSPDSAFCKHTSAPCRQVSLCFPGSPFSAQLPTRLIGTVTFFFIFFLSLLWKCSHLTALDYWDF